MIRSTESPACVIGSHGNAALETNVEAGAGLLEVFEAAAGQVRSRQIGILLTLVPVLYALIEFVTEYPLSNIGSGRFGASPKGKLSKLVGSQLPWLKGYVHPKATGFCIRPQTRIRGFFTFL